MVASTNPKSPLSKIPGSQGIFNNNKTIYRTMAARKSMTVLEYRAEFPVFFNLLISKYSVTDELREE
jgi:hypothetical protein